MHAVTEAVQVAIIDRHQNWHRSATKSQIRKNRNHFAGFFLGPLVVSLSSQLSGNTLRHILYVTDFDTKNLPCLECSFVEPWFHSIFASTVQQKPKLV